LCKDNVLKTLKNVCCYFRFYFISSFCEVFCDEKELFLEQHRFIIYFSIILSVVKKREPSEDAIKNQNEELVDHRKNSHAFLRWKKVFRFLLV